jgi:hypothetical protein
VRCALILLGTLACAGCRSEPPVATAPPSYENLEKISSAYRKATDTLNRAPRNLQELLPFVQEYGEPEKLLRSPGDNEEYVILYGVDYRTVQPFPVTIYEKNGVNGRRRVVRLQGVIELTDEELRNSPFPAGHKAPV